MSWHNSFLDPSVSICIKEYQRFVKFYHTNVHYVYVYLLYSSHLIHFDRPWYTLIQKWIMPTSWSLIKKFRWFNWSENQWKLRHWYETLKITKKLFTYKTFGFSWMCIVVQFERSYFKSVDQAFLAPPLILFKTVKIFLKGLLKLKQLSCSCILFSTKRINIQ